MIKKIEKKNKRIWLVFLMAVFVIASISYFYLLEEKEIGQGRVEEIKKCYQKKNGDRKRQIELTIIKSKKLSETLVKGEDLFKGDDSLIKKYDFVGIMKDNNIDALGYIDETQVERIYLVNDNGIIEGSVSEKGWSINTGNSGKKIANIVEKEKVKFDKKYLLPKIDCGSINNK